MENSTGLRNFFLPALLVFFHICAMAQPVSGDYFITDFPFHGGEKTLSVLKLHYTTLGRPIRDNKGHVANAVLILHGTGSSGHNFLTPSFAGVLFSRGQLLDTTKYASLPVAIAGRNRMMRAQAINLIEMDPAWNNGEYTTQPRQGLAGASSSLFFMNSSPLQLQQRAPTREAAEQLLADMEENYLSTLDANDLIYQLDASRDYDPSPWLQKIKAPLYAINSADDEINPPELGIMEKEIKKVPKGRYILLPTTEKTVGHGTNSLPAIWDPYLTQLLAASKAKPK